MESLPTTIPRENRDLPIRLPTRTSAFFHRWAERFWHGALLTLPLDALLVWYLPADALGPQFETALQRLTALCFAVGALGLFHDALFRQLEAAWRLAGHLDGLRARYGAALLGLFAVISLLDVVIHLGGLGWLVLAGIGVVGLGAWGEVRRMVAESASRRDELARDKVLVLEQRNTHLFLLVVGPIVALRLGALGGAVSASYHGLPEDVLAHYLSSAVIGLCGLLALYPHRERLIGRCPRCARPGSKVLASLSGCPACARDEYQIVPAQPYPMSAERTLDRNPDDPSFDEPDEPAVDAAAPPAPPWRAALERVFKRLAVPGVKDA